MLMVNEIKPEEKALEDILGKDRTKEIITKEQRVKEVHDIFEKFSNWNTVDSEREYDVLEHYALTGLVQFGISPTKRRPTACLTDTGYYYSKIMKRNNTI